MHSTSSLNKLDVPKRNAHTVGSTDEADIDLDNELTPDTSSISSSSTSSTSSSAAFSFSSTAINVPTEINSNEQPSLTPKQEYDAMLSSYMR